MRLFFDTNVLVSAFAARGLCADLLRLALTHHTLLTGEVVIAELRDVLQRKFRLPPDRIEAIEAFLREQPVAPSPGQTLGLGLVDAEDEWVVASAVLAKADILVSGDQGLLACTDPPLPILSPRQCWEPPAACTVSIARSTPAGTDPRGRRHGQGSPPHPNVPPFHPQRWPSTPANSM